jgi:hypothetical protein
VRVAGNGDIFAGGTKVHRQTHLSDQLTSTRGQNMNAEDLAQETNKQKTTRAHRKNNKINIYIYIRITTTTPTNTAIDNETRTMRVMSEE